MKVANPFKDRVMTHYDEYINSLKTADAFYRNINSFYDNVNHYTIHYHYTYINDVLYLALMLGSVIIDIYNVPETDNRIPIAVM